MTGRKRIVGTVLAIAIIVLGTRPIQAAEKEAVASRTGPVKVVEHSLVDDGGPFLGLGVSYFTALWRCKIPGPGLEVFGRTAAL